MTLTVGWHRGRVVLDYRAGGESWHREYSPLQARLAADDYDDMGFADVAKVIRGAADGAELYRATAVPAGAAGAGRG